MTRLYKLKMIFVLFISVQMIFIKLEKIDAQTDQDYKDIKSANKYFTEANYNLAAETYEKVIAKGFIAAELKYNLGNAYYRLGDYKHAILNYERALLLNPDDEDVKINLEFAQRYVQDKIEIVPTFFLIRWLQSFVNMFSANTWSYISIITFIFFLALLILFLFSKNIPIRKLSLYFGFLLIVVSIVGFYCAYSLNQEINSHSSAIVFSQAVTVKSSPNTKGTDLFIIHEGLKVSITGKSEGWKEIRLSDGRIGWLPEKSIEEI
jgi:tetratricopeptide (TPR) repeat protein